MINNSSKVVNLSEVMEDNPTLCLSTLRIFKKCHQCRVFQSTFRRCNKDLEKTLQHMACNPKLDKKMLALLERKVRLQREIAEINKQLGYWGDEI